MRNINPLHCAGVRLIIAAACLCMTCTVVRASTVVMDYDFKVVADGYSNWFSNDPDGATAAGKYSCPVGGSISTNTQTKLTSGVDTVATENTLAAAIAAGDYDSFTLTVPGGVTATFADLVYDYYVEKIFLTFSSYVLVDADGDGFDVDDCLGQVSLSDGAGPNPQALGNVVDISSLGAVTDTNIEFRIYYSDKSTANYRYHKVDNIRVLADVSAYTLAAYTFDGGDAASVDTEPRTTAGDYQISGGGGISFYNNRYFRGSETAATNHTDLAGALAANDYDSIVITIPDTACVLPEFFCYDYLYQNGYLTAMTYLLHDNEGDGFDVGDVIGSVSIEGESGELVAKTGNFISLKALGMLTNTNLELRLYYADNSNSGSRFQRVDNVCVSGTFAPGGTIIMMH